MYVRTTADQHIDDEDRFLGHLASFVVVTMMLGILTVSRALAIGTFVAIFATWGVLVATHGLRVFRRPPAARHL